MKKLMAANWKMYKTQDEARNTVRELIKILGKNLDVDREVLICPPFTSLSVVAHEIKDIHYVSVGGQNFYPANEGAYTGEISPKMLLDAGCSYALVGHSERRHIFLEKDQLLKEKVRYGLEVGLNIIFCIGEKIEERKAGKVEQVLISQLSILKGLVNEKGIEGRLSIAYEPVWAIGTGEVAGEKEILESHAIVRQELKNIFGEAGDSIRILYGGSVKPENAANIISIDNVDGVLVGGASLNAESFSKIITA
ncbi:triose-phosphate isomerase [Desulfothermus okinawensis JCM 13304]